MLNGFYNHTGVQLVELSKPGPGFVSSSPSAHCLETQPEKKTIISNLFTIFINKF